MFKKSLVAVAALAGVFGAAGAAQADDVVRVVQGTPVTIPVASGGFGGTAAAVAGCADGETRVGGGAFVIAGNSHSERYNLSSSGPISGERWWAFATNTDTANPGTLQAYAICAKVVKTTVLSTP
ncbi:MULTISPECIES: hypothetical protein [unclassified Streptomyces]|uniref:hypothetical protein n=1 Tax=unclassified Streptomyces TaxID=2593676 RepID=UPI0033B970E6